MANPIFLAPVADGDPCGPDLRWDPDFLVLGDAFAAAIAGQSAVIEGEVAETAEHPLDRIIDMATALSARTKDLRVLAIHAEASWRHGGLVAFAAAMADLAAVVRKWPGPADGIHPRADEVDGDLGERAAALGRLLNQVPALAATIGWGPLAGGAARIACASTLRKVFGAWEARLNDAFGADLPSASEAWSGIQGLLGTADAEPGDASATSPADTAPPSTSLDAWDLIDQALERMAQQDHHSPALPLLRMLSSWRSLGIIDIVDRMRASGVTFEQLMESVKRQTQEQ